MNYCCTATPTGSTTFATSYIIRCNKIRKIDNDFIKKIHLELLIDIFNLYYLIFSIFISLKM